MEASLGSAYRGRFGYDVIDESTNTIVPYIFRHNEKFCVTTVHLWHYYKFMEAAGIKLRPYLLDFGFFMGFEMYPEEQRLMDEINIYHNDGMYPFKFECPRTKYGDQQHHFMRLEHVHSIYQYLRDCTEKLKLGKEYQMKGNIAKMELISKESQLQITRTCYLPYVILSDKQRYVPLHMMYTNSTVPKSLKVTTLKGMDMMYMRFLLDVLDHIRITALCFEFPCLNLKELLKHLQKSGHINSLDMNYWPTKDNNNDLPHFFQFRNNNEESQQNVERKRKGSTSEETAKRSRTEDPNPNSNSVTAASANTKETPKTPKSKPSQSSTKVKNEEYTVEYLIDYRKVKGKEEVLVHWEGNYADTWEPVANLNQILKNDVPALRAKWEGQRQRK